MRNLEQEGRLRLQQRDGTRAAPPAWNATAWAPGYDQDPEPVHDRELDRLMRGDAPDVPPRPTAGAPPPPHKAGGKAPLWGQRYAKPTPAPPSAVHASTAPLSWADVGVDDEEELGAPGEASAKADAAKADAEKQIQEQLASDAAPSAAHAQKPEGVSGPSDAPALRAPHGAEETKGKARATAAEPRDADGEADAKADGEAGAEADAKADAKASADAKANADAPADAPDTDDDEYVHNPFDDDDE